MQKSRSPGLGTGPLCNLTFCCFTSSQHAARQAGRQAACKYPSAQTSRRTGLGPMVWLTNDDNGVDR